MIYIVDRSSVGNLHVMFNTGMLMLFQQVYPHQNIHFIAEAEHIEQVKKSLTKDQALFTFEAAPLVKSTAGGWRKLLQWHQKRLTDAKFLKRLYTPLTSDKDLVYFSSFPPISFSKIGNIVKRYPSIKTILTLHGELEQVYYPENWQHKIIRKLFLNLFAQRSDNLLFLIPTKVPANLLIKDGYLKQEQIVDIVHPYFYKRSDALKKLNPGVLRFGHVGSLGNRKNGSALFDLGNLLSKEIEAQEIIVQNIGPVEHDL